MRIYIVILIGILLVSCSPKLSPTLSYNSISCVDNKITLETIINDSSSFSIPINIRYRSSLDLKDPVIIYKNPLPIVSNYKLFRFQPKEKIKYKVSIISACDCIGFKKYMFIPNVYILDEDFNLIKTKEIANYFDYKETGMPLTIRKTWQIEEPVDGEISIIVYSDNSYLNSKIFKFIMLPFFIPVYIKSTLIGDFYITIEK